MSDTVIKVEGLWKEYRLGVISHHTLARDLQSFWAKFCGKEDPNLQIDAIKPNNALNSRSDDRFWALQDISFEVKKGEILGIIGRNGAGKSTLLKILSQVTTPTKGEVRFKGRIASLLEVGTGFHPELTGRENVFINGAILGMSKAEIRCKLDEIISFAEVEKFIDTPVKRYSSGMYVRLAFAVAAHLEPEILIVDEVLAVGDAQFQKKCLGKMEDVSAKEGRTVLFVSHNMASVKALCNKGLLIDKGKIVTEGDIENCINSYYSTNRGDGTIVSRITKQHHLVFVNKVTVNGSDADSHHLLPDFFELVVEVSGELLQPLPIELELRILDIQGIPLAFFSPGHEFGSTAVKSKGSFTISHTILLPRVNQGKYIADITLTNPGKTGWVDIPNAFSFFVEGSATKDGFVIDYKGGAGFILLTSRG